MPLMNLVFEIIEIRLAVPGLEEGRPSVLVGDFVLLKHAHLPDDPWHEACVHEVHQNHINLRFRDDFSTYKGTKFDVRFQLNLLPPRRMLQAVSIKSPNPERFLFPDPRHISTAITVSSTQLGNITPINHLIREDVEQWQTVAAIVYRPKGSVPFVVFGP
jgi:helicase MOV-10